MPDFAMCPGGDCDKKDRCFRYGAPPDPVRQTYFAEPPTQAEGGCAYFWPISTGYDDDGIILSERVGPV